MPNPNQISQTDILSIIGIFTGAISLVISLVTLWFSFFKPPNIKAGISHIAFNKISSTNDSRITDEGLLINFFIRNIGTRPALIENIRIRFYIDKQESFAFPTKKTLLELIQNIKSPEKLFHENGAPFNEIVLCKDEIWENDYIFSLVPKQYTRLKGKGFFEIQIKYNKKWKSVNKKDYSCVLDRFDNTPNETIYLYTLNPVEIEQTENPIDLYPLVLVHQRF